MNSIVEGSLRHSFEPSWTASKYDKWPFYQRHFEGSLGGNKAVDVLAQGPDGTCWFIELKDYRQHRRTKPMDLCDEVAIKVRDTLAGVFVAAKCPAEHVHQSAASRHLAAKKLRVVLHLEQPKSHSKSFPRVFDPAKVQQEVEAAGAPGRSTSLGHRYGDGQGTGALAGGVP